MKTYINAYKRILEILKILPMRMKTYMNAYKRIFEISRNSEEAL